MCIELVWVKRAREGDEQQDRKSTSRKRKKLTAEEEPGQQNPPAVPFLLLPDFFFAMLASGVKAGKMDPSECTVASRGNHARY